MFGGFEFVDLIMWLGSLVVVFTGSLLFGCSVAGWLRDGCWWVLWCSGSLLV